MVKSAVTNISVMYNVALVTLGKLPNDIRLISDIFNCIAGQNINIDMISQAPPYKGTINLSFSLPSEHILKALTELNKFKKNVPQLVIEVDAHNTKISVFGKKMKELPGVAASFFTVLASNSIDIKLVTTSEVDISCLIYEKDVDKALESIQYEFEIDSGAINSLS